MKVYLTIDTEVWCDGWHALDAVFPQAFDRYVYGRSSAGAFALPETFKILAEHGLPAVFFVDPMFSGRFGLAPLAEIVGLIQEAGHEIQLHLHPEWTDEMHQPPIADATRKRQYLIAYNRDEQAALIKWGAGRLQEAGAPAPTAFRAGSYAGNADTLAALASNGIFIDSSMNATSEISGGGLREAHTLIAPFVAHGVTELPITAFRDGRGRLRHAQIGACSFAELRQALKSAYLQGCEHFVLVSHNFEMLQTRRSTPDRIVARRFAALCRYLAAHPNRYQLSSMTEIALPLLSPKGPVQVSRFSTARRFAEQAVRRFL